MPAEWEREGDAEGEPDDELRPGDTDYELSEDAGWDWEPRERTGPPPWLMVALSILLVIALVVPSLVIIARWG